MAKKGRPKEDKTRVDTQMLTPHYTAMRDRLEAMGYTYHRSGKAEVMFGVFLDALAQGIIADDGENIIFKVPYRKP